ncbi:hypothetical protein NA56DRAFT_113850 [Hyaloscypha hepaticicola]|uniref:Uncharacterized protein n=1 Tax=Hyaloscypha hepaticicola TaxID=2082293 RepID=A0A2J6Q774_9HELO|nr:hypothetical protein NA56DRAFT_113850 [Hyaloscypha hepaticicola]
MRGRQLIAYQVIIMKPSFGKYLVPKASKSLIPCPRNHPRGPLGGINTAGKVATIFSNHTRWLRTDRRNGQQCGGFWKAMCDVRKVVPRYHLFPNC